METRWIIMVKKVRNWTTNNLIIAQQNSSLLRLILPQILHNKTPNYSDSYCLKYYTTKLLISVSNFNRHKRFFYKIFSRHFETREPGFLQRITLVLPLGNSPTTIWACPSQLSRKSGFENSNLNTPENAPFWPICRPIFPFSGPK